MTLADTVADGDGGKFSGNAAGFGNAQFYMVSQFLQVKMAGDHFCKGVDHSNHGLFEVFFVQACGIQQGPVGGALDAIGQLTAAVRFVLHLAFVNHLFCLLLAGSLGCFYHTMVQLHWQD